MTPEEIAEIEMRADLAFREEPCSLSDEQEAQLNSAADVPALLAALVAAEADRDRARDAAVALEQENARLREWIKETAKEARARDEELLTIRDRRSAQGDHRLSGELERAAHEVRMVADVLDGGEAL